jgi:hypothetical protein
MRKIIPFAFAVILVLGGGFYLFSSKIIQVPKTVIPETGNTQDSTNVNSAGSTITPTTIPAEKVNQITLSVTAPANNATVSVASVTVKGMTLPGADVSVNEKDVVAGANGAFSANLSLEEGDNYIIVVAIDADGNVAEQEMTITYTPAE